MRRANRRSHAQYQFVIDLAKFLSVQSRSGLAILFKYKHCSTVWVQVSDNSHLVIVQARSGNFVKFVNRLVRQFATALKTLLSVTFHVVAPNCNVFVVSLIGVTCMLVLISFENDFCLPSLFCYVSHILDMFWVCLALFMSWGLFLHPSLIRTCPHFLMCFQDTWTGYWAKTAAAALSVTVQHNRSWKVWNLLKTIVDSEELSRRIFQIFFPVKIQPGEGKDCAPTVILDRRLSPNFVVFLLAVIWSKSLRNPLPIDEDVLSLILTCVHALTASVACPWQPSNLEMTSKTFAAVICDTEAPRSVNME